MARRKLSDEERQKRRREANHRYNAKRRPGDVIIDLNHHPNSFANLATSELREQYSRELEDGIVEWRVRLSMEYDIHHDPDEEEFKDSNLDNDEDGIMMNGSFVESMEGDSISMVVADETNSSSPSSSSSSINPSRSIVS